MQLEENTQIVPIFFVYTFLKKLITPFDQTDAFRLGIIDASGNILRKRSTLKTRPEKAAYTIFDTLVWNIKKLIEKLPGGRTKLMTYASALWLIHEAHNAELYEEKPDLMEMDMKKFIDELDMTDKEKEQMDKIGAFVDEEIANVSGLGVATDQPYDPKKFTPMGYDPKIKYSEEQLHARFNEMCEDIANITGAGVATDQPFNPKSFSPGSKKDIIALRRVKPYMDKKDDLTKK